MLEQQTVEVPIPDDMKACPTCGGTEHDLADEVTPRIEYLPGRFVRRRHRRRKIVRKCRCPGTSIVVAPAPPAPIVGGLYGVTPPGSWGPAGTEITGARGPAGKVRGSGSGATMEWSA